MQILRPASDVSNSGWALSSGSDIYALLDEDPANDAGYIRATNNALRVCEVKLDAGSDPNRYDNWELAVRAWLDAEETVIGTPVYRAHFYCGNTLVHTFSFTPGLSPATLSVAVPTGEAEAVQDYEDLRLRFEADFNAGNPLGLRISQAYLMMDDAPPPDEEYSYGTPSVVQCQWPYPGETQAIEEPINDDLGVLKADEPVSLEDAQGGEICAATGAWYPARRIVYVDGLPYGDINAPEPNAAES